MKSLRDRGYLVASALVLMMAVLFFATATLARYRSKTTQSQKARTRTQNRAAARSATAKLLAEFNRAGRFEAQSDSLEGEIGGMEYTANVRADADHPDLLHLTAIVGRETYTRVLRQEAKRNHLAFVTTQQTAGPLASAKNYVQSAVGGEWEEFEMPPSPPGTVGGVFATAANQEGDYFAVRVESQQPNLFRYQRANNDWEQLPSPPMRAIRGGNSTQHTVVGDSGFAAANREVFLGFTSSDPLVRNDSIWSYDMQEQGWKSLASPLQKMYSLNGESQSTVKPRIERLVSGNDNLLVDFRADSDVSTLLFYSGDEWQRLPPISTGEGGQNEAVTSMSVSPSGKVTALKRGRDGRHELIRLSDGDWTAGELPELGALSGSGPRIYFDSEGREWLSTGNKIFRCVNGQWDESSPPPSDSKELEIGGQPDESLFQFQTTAGY